jgi:serine protease Do
MTNRSHQTQSDEDVSLPGFVAALNAGLQIHAEYPSNQAELSGKQPHVTPEYSTPEQFPRLSNKYSAKLDYEGKVAASCIHCHQVGESLHADFRDHGKPIPLEMLFPYPHPKVLGLIMDPTCCAKVARVENESSAERDGFHAGDEILTLDGQSIISIADLQWVLHHASHRQSLPATIRRDGRMTQVALALPPGWRSRGDISWRATSWALGRMTTGGMRLEDLTPEDRAKRKLHDDSMALIVTRLGEFGDNAHAKNRGFKKGDVITSVAGESKRMRESDLFAMLVNQPIGTETPFKLLRGSEQVQLSLVMQK